MSQAGQFYRNGLVSTLTGDIGGVVIPIADNINLLGGTGVTVTGTPATGTLTIDLDSIVATSFPSDSGIAVPDLGVLKILGGKNIHTMGLLNEITVILDDNIVLTGTLEAKEIESDTYINAGGDITSIAGDISTLAGDITSGAALKSNQNLDVATGVRFRSITDGILLGDSDGNVSASSVGNSFTGFVAWDGVGPYFDDTVLGEFTLTSAGSGLIHSQLVTWTAPQTVTSLVAGNTYYIYIDSLGHLLKTNTYDPDLYKDYIVLFQCLRDSTSGTNIQYTVKENHPWDFQPAVSNYLHETVGTVIENSNNGANIAINGSQKIQIDGADYLADHGIYTEIPDSGSAAVVFNKMYTNASGKWVTQNATDTFSGYWNNAGTPTALTEGSFATYRLYVSKDSINSSNPIYWAVLDTSEYETLLYAKAAIANDTTAKITNELAMLEMAQLGFIIFSEADDEIVEVTISKSTVGSSASGSVGSGMAALITTESSSFNGILSSADTNVQDALETIDQWGKTTTDHCLLIGNGTGSAIGSLAAGATGEFLIGNTGADPSWSSTLTLTTVSATTFETSATAAGLTITGSSISSDGTDENIDINITAKGTGKVIIDELQLTTDLAVSEGGTGASTLTDHGVLLGSGTSAVTVTAVGTNGQVLLGSTGADPAFATLTSTGGTITFTPGANTLNLESSSVGFAWSEVTSGSQAMAVGNGYIANYATLVTATLPATAALGSVIKITGKGAGGWKIAQNASQYICFGTATTTTGVSGYISSTQTRDSVELVCTTENVEFNVISAVGNITVA